MSKSDINLLKTQSRLSPQIEAIIAQLRVVSIILITITITIGIGVAIAFLIFTNQLSQVKAEEEIVQEQIIKQAKKEALFVSLKARLPMIEKAMESQKPWELVFDYLPTIAPLTKMVSVNSDDKNIVQITLRATSIEESASMVNAVISLAKNRKIRNPQLVGLTLVKDGAVQLSFSFLPVF